MCAKLGEDEKRNTSNLTIPRCVKQYPNNSKAKKCLLIGTTAEPESSVLGLMLFEKRSIQLYRLFCNMLQPQCVSSVAVIALEIQSHHCSIANYTLCFYPV